MTADTIAEELAHIPIPYNFGLPQATEPLNARDEVSQPIRKGLEVIGPVNTKHDLVRILQDVSEKVDHNNEAWKCLMETMGIHEMTASFTEDQELLEKIIIEVIFQAIEFDIEDHTNRNRAFHAAPIMGAAVIIAAIEVGDLYKLRQIVLRYLFNDNCTGEAQELIGRLCQDDSSEEFINVFAEIPCIKAGLDIFGQKMLKQEMSGELIFAFLEKLVAGLKGKLGISPETIYELQPYARAWRNPLQLKESN